MGTFSEFVIDKMLNFEGGNTGEVSIAGLAQRPRLVPSNSAALLAQGVVRPLEGVPGEGWRGGGGGWLGGRHRHPGGHRAAHELEAGVAGVGDDLARHVRRLGGHVARTLRLLGQGVVHTVSCN